MPTRTSSAQWQGSLKDGSGTMALGSGAFEGPYSFPSRFENGQGTNPEELIAAAHAGCFSMAFSNMLSQAGHVPTSVDTKASVHLEKTDAGFGITRIDLVTRADVPGVNSDEFQKLAEQAKANCPVSKALAAVDITLDATLV
ncbi:OsmC family protein [Planosporangium mesophilum]|nr:OsmC family protein [Planosporangium mesophilum]NJC82354.1 OsmC family protein [Planosporangium mesophilum]